MPTKMLTIFIVAGLSLREQEIATAVTEGLSNKEVGNQFFITEKTVKFHLTNIYKKLNLTSRAQLIVLAMKNPATGPAGVNPIPVETMIPTQPTTEALPVGSI